MTIQIGRAGRDSALTLRSPANWDWKGDEATLQGTLDASTLTKLLYLRGQVNGLVDNEEEPIVGLNWAADPTVDGFYEVLDGDVPMPPRGLAALRLAYRLRLRRVAAYPDINSLMVGDSVRNNAHSIAKGSTVPWWAVPADAAMSYIPDTSVATRTGEFGDVTLRYRTDGTVLYNRINRWQCLASDYYDAACRFEVTDGVAWYSLVGLRHPGVSPAAGLWRMSNGFVRVTADTTAGRLSFEYYKPSSGWQTPRIFKLTTGSTPTTIGAFRTFTIVRNTPEVCTVRLCLDQATVTNAAITVDLTIRRGSLYVEGVMSRTAEVGDYLNNELGIFNQTATASTAHTAGVHGTSADSGGGKYVLNTSVAKTNDLTQGGFYVASSVDDMEFQIAYEPASASGPDTFTNLTYAWFAVLDETVGFARR